MPYNVLSHTQAAMKEINSSSRNAASFGSFGPRSGLQSTCQSIDLHVTIIRERDTDSINTRWTDQSNLATSGNLHMLEITPILGNLTKKAVFNEIRASLDFKFNTILIKS